MIKVRSSFAHGVRGRLAVATLAVMVTLLLRGSAIATAYDYEVSACAVQYDCVSIAILTRHEQSVESDHQSFHNPSYYRDDMQVIGYARAGCDGTNFPVHSWNRMVYDAQINYYWKESTAAWAGWCEYFASADMLAGTYFSTGSAYIEQQLQDACVLFLCPD